VENVPFSGTAVVLHHCVMKRGQLD